MFHKFVVIGVLCASSVVVGSADEFLPPLNPHIVGGEGADIEDFPFMVSIQIFGMHTCGGSILGPKIIITAAHCTVNRPVNHMTVFAGSTTLSGDGFTRSVDRILKHPKYQPLQLYDIGLLFLKEKLIFNEYVHSIPLAIVRPPIDSPVTIMGWGFLEEREFSNSDRLQEATLTIVSPEDCTEAYRKMKRSYINKPLICAMSKGTLSDSCQNDSGGPMIYKGHLVGVVSYGYGCARKGYPGIYTSIPDLYDWILGIVMATDDF